MPSPEDHFKTSPPNLAVFVCRHVADRSSPVLRVTHDDDGSWQFLCGAGHGEGSGETPKLWGLDEVLALDSSLRPLGTLCVGHEASRSSPKHGWILRDATEDVIMENVQKYGWHAAVIEAGEGPSEPTFVYSIGLFRTWSIPDLIVFGLQPKNAHGALSAAVQVMREHGPLKDGEHSSEIFEQGSAIFRTVRKRWYSEYLGYGMWFYRVHGSPRGGLEFPVLQLFYPDKDGKFPWEAEYQSEGRYIQPLLFRD